MYIVYLREMIGKNVWKSRYRYLGDLSSMEFRDTLLTRRIIRIEMEILYTSREVGKEVVNGYAEDKLVGRKGRPPLFSAGRSDKSDGPGIMASAFESAADSHSPRAGKGD